MKKVAIAGVLTAAVLILAGCGNNSSQTNKNSAAPASAPTNQKAEGDYAINQGELVFFWGEGCPHCVNIEKFLADNAGLEAKLKIKKIEVFKDSKGQKLFLEKVKECGLSTAGVPVLYKDGKCTQGDTPIIDELKKDL